MAVPAFYWSRVAWRGALAGAFGTLLLGAALSAAARYWGPHVSNLVPFAVLFVAIGIAWGIGYAYLAETQTQINRHPFLSGLTFGAVVYVVTQIVLYGIAAEQTHTAQLVAFGLAATCLLFGLPVAIVTQMLGRSEKAR